MVRQAGGSGVLFVQSLGAIIERTLAAGEDLIVDNGSVLNDCLFSLHVC
jgi:uncharacterized protein (AIM24 family)